MKSFYLLILSLLSVSILASTASYQNIASRKLPTAVRAMKSLHLFHAECSYHGVYFDGRCYCYTNYIGVKCSEKTVPGWFDTNDQCDDLMSRVDSLMNISPDQYNGDDDEFPRKSGDSIGKGTPAYGSNPTKWMKLHDAVEKFEIFPNQLRPTDIMQGALGDCYLLAALTSLTMIQNGDFIKNAFVTQKDNDKHVYIVRWLLNGKPRLVAVDEWVPGDGSPSYSHIGSNNAVYPLLIEKVWAKIHGNYMAIEAGQSTDIWNGLTQAPKYFKFIKDWNGNSAGLFAELKRLSSNGWAVGLSTPSDKSKTGDVEGHAYSLLGTFTVIDDYGRTFNLVRIMNPWHKDEFKTNPWADTSSRWTAKLKSQVVNWSNDEKDGIYYVEINDLIRNYEDYSWCEISRGFDSAYQDVYFQNSNAYSTKFVYSGPNVPAIYLTLYYPDKRLLIKGCSEPFTVEDGVYVTTPNGQTIRGDYYNVVTIKNPTKGTYVIKTTVTKRKEWARYFTLTAYAPTKSVAFADIPNNKNVIKTVNCPSGCSGNGRCNFFNGKCTCYAAYSGYSCETKIYKPCPSNCNGNGVCDTSSGTCSCNDGFTGDSCTPCTDKNDFYNCNIWVQKKYCESTSDYFKWMTGEACQKMCGQLGYKGTGTCYMDPAKYKCVASKFCNAHGTCNPANGVCTCQKGYGGNNCDTQTCKDLYGNCPSLAQQPGICSLSPSNRNIHIAKGCALSCNNC